MSTPISPDHYQGHIECIDAIHSALGKEGFVAYCRGNAMKYVFRAGKKGPEETDIQKAAQYLEFAKNVIKGLSPRGNVFPEDLRQAWFEMEMQPFKKEPSKHLDPCPLLANPLNVPDEDAKTLQQQVTAWQDATFPKTDVRSYVKKLVHEVDELESSIHLGHFVKTVEELADVQIVLWGLANKLGINLDAAVEDKHRINQQRKWERMKDGTYQHVEEVDA